MSFKKKGKFKKMEFLGIIFLLIIIIILIKVVYQIDVKKIKQIAENNKELDEIAKKYPSNIEICKSILKKLNNEKVQIQEGCHCEWRKAHLHQERPQEGNIVQVLCESTEEWQDHLHERERTCDSRQCIRRSDQR